MKESSRYNIRYVGFESLVDGGRRLDYAITAQGAPARSASVHFQAVAFNGPDRVTFQESATIACERIRHELDTQTEIQIAPQEFMSGANASPIGRSHQEKSGANASPVGRSHQEKGGANASPVGRSHQEKGGANASPVGRSHQKITVTLSAEDIEQFRPRRRATGKRP